MAGVMSDPRNPRHGDSSFTLGILIGGAIGFVIGAALMGLASYKYMQWRMSHFSSTLATVVVASVDIAPNTPISFDQISQRSVPENLATESVVRPEAVDRIIGQRINVPVRAEDMLLWSQLESSKPRKQSPCMVAARDLAVGTKLTEADLEDKELPPDLATSSFIRQSERSQILGRPLTTAFRKGDPILWTHF
jgi:Flp pilus assembly protein CpaB